MKNNLLKTIAVIAIAVAMLATSVTSFAAATATTVTTYNETSKTPHVVSTVTGVGEGVMVTYLATKKGGSDFSNEDVVYIDQKTSDGIDSIIEFEYDALNSTEAQILYGSNGEGVPAELNGADKNKAVSIGGVTVTKDDGVASYKVMDSENKVTDKLGSTETGTLSVTLRNGYELVSVKVGSDTLENPIITAIPVKAGDVVDITTKNTSCPVTISVVNVESSDLKTVYDANGNELQFAYLLCQITSNIEDVTECGVYAKKDDKAFELDTEDKTYGYYPSLGISEEYYAVRLLAEDMSGVTLLPYCKYDDGKVKIFN